MTSTASNAERAEQDRGQSATKITLDQLGDRLQAIQAHPDLPEKHRAGIEYWTKDDHAALNVAAPEQLNKLIQSLVTEKLWELGDTNPQPDADNAPAGHSAPVAGVSNANFAPARALFDAGLKLCALHPESKRPVGEGWNKPENCVQVFDEKLSGYGLPLAINGRCSIDPDDLEMSKIVFGAWGFDYEEVMGAGVRTVSTRPGSGGRSQFKAAADLGWIKFRVKLSGKNHTVLELRAGSPNLQDVIPGLMYRDGAGNLCTQNYANGRTFLDVPDMPERLRVFWERMGDLTFRKEQELKATEALAAAGYPVDVIHDFSGISGVKAALPFDITPHIRAACNEMFEVPPVLERHGYTEHGRGRWSSPGSTGEPGIRLIPKTESLWRSDHGSDPLNGTFDAAAAILVLDFAYNIGAFEDWMRQNKVRVDFGAEPIQPPPVIAQWQKNSGADIPADPEPDAGAEADPRWKFKPLDMAKVMRDDPKPIKWLFRQRVPGNRGALLTGLGGTSKTQMLYQMAITAILGHCPWGWEVDTTGKAVLILTEDDANDPHITIHTIKVAMGLSAEQCRKIEESLIVFPLAGEDLKLMIRDPDSGSLIESGLLRGFEEMVKEVGGVAFVGIDPALGVTEGDEASQSDQRALGRMADNLAVRCDCSVFILTHGTKGSLQSDEIGSHSSRGGGAITDAVRAEYGMRTMTPKEAEKYGVTDIAERESYVQLKATKGNRIPPEAKVPVWFRRGRGGYLEVVELVEAQRGGISPLAKRVLDTLIEMDPENAGVRLQDWRHRCIEKGVIAGPTEDALKKAMGRAVKSIGNRIKKKDGERGFYQLNCASFDVEGDDDIEDAA